MAENKPTQLYSTPEQCEQAFYDAFRLRDVDAMMDIWDREFPLTCIHPGSAKLDSREEIAESWSQIFEMSQNIDFARSEIAKITEGILSVHTLREEILMHEEPINTMLITNIFRFDGESWRLVLHHVSSEPDIEAFDDETDEMLALSADEFSPPPTIH